MRIAFIASGIGLSGCMTAAELGSAGPSVEYITPENAVVRGFDVSVEIDGSTIIAEINGPGVSDQGCAIHRVGSVLTNTDSEEISVTLIETSEASALGYYLYEQHRLGFFFDYLCEDSNVMRSRRYEIESIADFRSRE